MVNGNRVRQAREIAGLTQAELAAGMGVDQSYVSLVEQGARSPLPEMVERISLALGFPPSFFGLPNAPDFPLGSLLYRKRSVAATDIAKSNSMARSVVEMVERLAKDFRMPTLRVPDGGGEEPEEAAQLFRSSLGYGPRGPIRGLMTRLEKAGVIVFRLPFNIDGLDGFSTWPSEGQPVIALGPERPGDRERATVAEEAGHLVCHRSFLGDTAGREREADAFALELLLPAEDMREEIASGLTLLRLSELKAKWGVSMQFLLWRFESLSLITPQKKSYWRGRMHRQSGDWLLKEPVDIPRETPKLLRQLLVSAYGEPLDYKTIGRAHSLPWRLIQELDRVNAPSSALPPGVRRMTPTPFPSTGR